MGNLDLYNKVRTVPAEAQKPIVGGRLKGMTDISPMWRIKTLTEQFGMVGVGWYYEITSSRTEEGTDGERVAIVDINLFVKPSDSIDWSAPIVGTGGSMLVASEKSGLHTNDEAFKMALTDAISVACKALGMGADIYWQKDRSKYDRDEDVADKIDNAKQGNPVTTTTEDVCKCSACGVAIADDVNDYSIKHYGKALCRICQKKRVAPANQELPFVGKQVPFDGNFGTNSPKPVANNTYTVEDEDDDLPFK